MAEDLAERVAQKVGTLPARIGAALAHEIAPRVLAERVRAFAAWADAITVPRGEIQPVGALSAQVVQAMEQHAQPLASAALAVRDTDVIHTHRDSKEDKLPWDWYRELPKHLLSPRAVLLDKTDPTGALLMVFDLPAGGTGKLVVKVDYRIEVRGADGIKRRGLANILRSGKIVGETALRDRASYTLLDGQL